MDIGIVGLSGATGDVARRLARGGVNVFGFDAQGRAAALADEKILVAMPTAVALAHALSAPRIVWMNVAPGFDTEIMIQELWPELAAGDVIVDAGAADYQDAARREAALATVKIHFIDIAVAGPEGDSPDGPVLYFGGTAAAARVFAPVADILASERGCLHCGPAGSGHLFRTMLGTVPRQVLSMVTMLESGNPRGNANLERLRALCESFGRDVNK